MRRSIDDKMKAEVVRLRKEMFPVKQISAITGISQPTVNVICRSAGLTLPRHAILAAMPDEDYVMDLFNAGFTNTQIVAKCRSNSATISRIISRKLREKDDKPSRPPAEYSNTQQFEYHTAVKERRI